MTCDHLIHLERELIARGFVETFRGQAWSHNAREWVYFDVCLDMPAVRERFAIPDFVADHEHLGTHDGQEAGFVCQVHQDGIMGRHPSHCAGVPTFP
jgi:hypothetical protein